MMKASSLLLILLLASLSVGLGQNALAQIPKADNRLIAVKVTGSKRFAEDPIIASTGLQLGAPVGEDDFKRASRHLADTGAFTEVAYTYSYSSAGTKLDLRVTDATDFVPARFEDFVWFTDAELRSRIKQHVPLFDGEVPLSGNLADQVSDVLQAMLVEGAIPGHVDYLRAAKEDGPVDAVSYHVSDVLIRVRNIEFTGAGEAELPALQAATGKYPEPREYSRSRLSLLVQKQLLPVYQSRGYLKASFGDPQPKSVNPMVAANSPQTEEVLPHNLTVVDVTFAVTPGPQYKLKSLDWSGNKEFPAERLQKMAHAEPGQPANTVKLTEDLKEIQKLYGSRGYITAALKADAQFDDAASAVTLVVNVKEGFEYHMGELEFRGLDNSQTARLRDAFKLRPGDVYDATYLEQYLPEARKLLTANLDWLVSAHVTANIKDKTVDVDLIYSVKAPK
jgi:outer membrane protein assembly factor BamA